MADATAGYLFRAADFSVKELHTSNGVSGSPSNVYSTKYFIPWATIYSGVYKIQGSCTLNGDPVGGRRVYLMPHSLGLLIGGVAVGSDGLFLFDGLSPGKYKVVGEDVSGATNGVVWAYVDAVPR